MKMISSWGRLTKDPHHVIDLHDPSSAHHAISSSHYLGLARGMGRSYGDVCLNAHGALWLSKKLDCFIHFNQETGLLRCESGVLLRDIQQRMLPRGWMLAVTPGTQWITVGGAVANDVHGKNHHAFGSFGDHLRAIKLLRTTGEVIECSQDKSEALFAATIGGLGLTGVILEVTLQLRPLSSAWLNVETIPYADFRAFFQLADDSEAGWEHTVSWLDCFAGRGIFIRANPRTEQFLEAMPSRSFSVPFVPPVSFINRFSLKPFNTLYYQIKARGAGQSIIHYEPFFYPLDRVLKWNRLYGPKGFFQYQCVIPRESGLDALEAMRQEMLQANRGSFLTVLKTFGERESVGMLSFPQAGVSLAMDFSNDGEPTHRLFARFDSIIREAKGRLYPAKDARMPRDLFEQGYPRLGEFIKYRDPGISSSLSRRLLGS